MFINFAVIKICNGPTCGIEVKHTSGILYRMEICFNSNVFKIR